MWYIHDVPNTVIRYQSTFEGWVDHSKSKPGNNDGIERQPKRPRLIVPDDMDGVNVRFGDDAPPLVDQLLHTVLAILNPTAARMKNFLLELGFDDNVYHIAFRQTSHQQGKVML